MSATIGCATQDAAWPESYALVNANVVTMDPARPRAEALAVENGRIAAVGTADEVRVLAARHRWRTIDLAGKTVMPGLIDAHAHITGLGRTLDPDVVDARDAAGPQEIAARAAAVAARLETRKDRWVIGRGWDQNRWAGDWKGRWPTAAELDAADRPVWLKRVDGHAGWANSAAMKIACIDAKTSDPPGGTIVRDAAGHPTGIFIDTAMQLIERHIPPPTLIDRVNYVRRAAEECAKLGITCVHDACVTGEMHEAFLTAATDGGLPIRIYGMADGKSEFFRKLLRDGPVGNADNRVVVQAVKFFTDGALGSRGAALLEPYSDEPATRGLWLTPQSELETRSREAMAAGFQVCVHAIGDAANRAVLDVFEKLHAEQPKWRGLRPRVEHAQILAAEDILRFAKIGVFASIQPTHATSDMPWAEKRLGPARLRGAYAYKSLADSGARMAGGSDFPVEPANPMFGIHAAVTRQDRNGNPSGGWLPAERLDRGAALRLFAIDAAYAGFAENDLGSIAPGKFADLIVLDRDITAVPAGDIPDIVVERTISGGRVVYERGK